MKNLNLKTKLITLFTLILVFSLMTQVVGCAANVEKAKPMEVQTDNSSRELQLIKSLAGRWTSTTSMFGKENEKVFTEYSITAGGSAVLERIFPGTPQEMVSVYYDDDNGKLAMTHYCMLRNRPYFKLEKSGPDEIKMDVIKIEGNTSKDTPSMGAMTIKFEDNNHFISTCEGEGKEKGKKEAHSMRYTRVAE